MEVEPKACTPSPCFDWDAYCARYSGQGLIMHIRHIASVCPSLKIIALRRAVEEIKITTRDCGAYEEVVSELQSLAEDVVLDTQWIYEAKEKDMTYAESLQVQLQNFKKNTMFEKIRTTYEEIGNSRAKRGDFRDAFQTYLQMKDFSKTPETMIESGLKVVSAALMTKQYHVVVHNAMRFAEPFMDKKSHAMDCIHACVGIAYFGMGKFNEAINHFIQISEPLQRFSNILATQDVALCATLCGLANLGRQEITDKLLSPSMKSILECLPRCFELIENFQSLRFKSFLEDLETFFVPDLEMDMFMCSKVQEIATLLRRKAIRTYTSAFTAVRLEKLSDVFGLGIDALEQELSLLILNGEVSGRLDSKDHVLYAQVVDERAQLFSKTMAFHERHMMDFAAVLHYSHAVEERGPGEGSLLDRSGSLQ
eukprot:TRINITY_DN80523_c0_g1_i1.p1 TRINITY_DN80523_c0_g1~~TRINITY_DN80523_c0_g1_i1.p1  ORF type:complete len:424 (+),score=110.07 TRINITY_DN80523_c0_g1_i1:66-1337(+)